MEESLNQPYLYQHPKTNKASTSSLSLQQLCRMLCPMSSNNSNNVGYQLIHPDNTLLISFDPQTNQFSEKGWLTARNIPVLREASSNWYYEQVKITSKNSEEEGQSCNDNNVMGPISCRTLAQAYHNKNDQNIVVNDQTRVWSPELSQHHLRSSNTSTKTTTDDNDSGWTCIAQSPNLQISMQAFLEAPPPWSFDDEKDKKTVEVSSSDQSKRNRNKETHVEKIDPSIMVYDNDDDDSNDNTEKISKQRLKEQEELESFLSSTANIGPQDDIDNDKDEEYESDGGTTYIKDCRTDKWVHADLVPSKKKNDGKRKLDEDTATTESVKSDDKTVHTSNISGKTNTSKQLSQKRKKTKGAKFKAKNSKNWIYITNLPPDTTEEELVQYFSKVGLIDLDPETQKPKVKLYRYKKGDVIPQLRTAHSPNVETLPSQLAEANTLKGDASICFARPESVDLAIQILDESYFRSPVDLTNLSANTTTDNRKDTSVVGNSDKNEYGKIKVQRAKFEQHGKKYHESRREVSDAKRKVVRLARLQAIGWDEDGENGRITGGLKGLRIVVIKHLFTLQELCEAAEQARGNGSEGDKGEDNLLHKLEQDMLNECKQWGTVEKITVFSKNIDGIMVVKFTQPSAASKAVEVLSGKIINNRKLEASFWDGVTDFTVKDDEKDDLDVKKRLEDFGNWLDGQELPDEFRLNVEGAD